MNRNLPQLSRTKNVGRKLPPQNVPVPSREEWMDEITRNNQKSTFNNYKPASAARNHDSAKITEKGENVCGTTVTGLMSNSLDCKLCALLISTEWFDWFWKALRSSLIFCAKFWFDLLISDYSLAVWSPSLVQIIRVRVQNQRRNKWWKWKKHQK